MTLQFAISRLFTHLSVYGITPECVASHTGSHTTYRLPAPVRVKAGGKPMMVRWAVLSPASHPLSGEVDPYNCCLTLHSRKPA